MYNMCHVCVLLVGKINVFEDNGRTVLEYKDISVDLSQIVSKLEEYKKQLSIISELRLSCDEEPCIDCSLNKSM